MVQSRTHSATTLLRSTIFSFTAGLRRSRYRYFSRTDSSASLERFTSVMVQSRTHTCNQLRMEHVGQKVTIVGWYDNMRKVSKNLGFLILRDFYGVTQVVVERNR